ncbi:c-type cytochrome biogenesis protein CcmI [Photobacterium atrarenae]|uniref:C-type cytochrome biogenesis protein CcmI n=1 Tax=Photobacterium atrarenae TaxID=865757 RepID=A0ABY5GDP6_9GAMM|nr:c-type cytochrome biogenesis protein CcmI [Photobacterium atrarenae]UTV26996.1 c-type cytochrome biogenesis protein CcmI [Photobacterium atrarenae]
MTLFWLVTVALVLLAALIFVAPVFFGKAQDDTASRDELNKAFFKDRVGELESEASEGLVSNREELVSELQQSLLDDVPANSDQRTAKSSPAILIPGLLILVGVSYGAYLSVGSIDKVDSWQQTVQQLPELSKRLMQGNQGEPLTDQEMDAMTLGLRTRLHETPDDATGWLLLGRIGMANRDADTAQGAMKRAYALDPNNPEVQLSYAQTLMMIGDPAQSEQARRLLKAVVKQDHTNLRAMSLLAFDAYERADYEQAVSYWTMMKNLIGDQDSRAQMLTRSIERAQAQLQAANNAANSDASVAVKIELDPTVNLPTEGVVIVSVHSADGAPMPVAARRIPLSQFPISLTLTDGDSMIPERQMSSLPSMIVKARIDTDGNVMTKQGDWYGQSDVIPLGGSTNVLINKQY